MAEAWSRYGIVSNAIAPGMFPTDLTAPVFGNPELAARFAALTAIGRNGELPDLDGTAIFLAARASAYVTGQVIARRRLSQVRPGAAAIHSARTARPAISTRPPCPAPFSSVHAPPAPSKALLRTSSVAWRGWRVPASNWCTVTTPTPASFARSCWLHASSPRAALHCAGVIMAKDSAPRQ